MSTSSSEIYPKVIDAFISPCVHCTFNTQSITLGLIGGTGFAAAKAVTLLVFGEFEKLKDEQKLLHEGVRGFVVRIIYTQDLISAAFGSGIYMTAQVMTFAFEKTNLSSKPFAKTVFEAFKLGFMIEGSISKSFTEGLIWGGARYGAAKTVSLLFKQAMMSRYNLKTDEDYNKYLNSYSKHLDSEIVDAFIAGFMRGFILNANPISALSNALINVTATKIVKMCKDKL